MDTRRLPHEPGCYLFKDKAGRILYIGKAKDIRKRVQSYFRKERDLKTEAMIAQADSVDFIVTDTEAEALILENNLIKKHQPKYNIDLKDSKRYAYIELTAEEYPRLLVARKVDKGAGKVFGPFTSAAERDEVLKIVRQVFGIRTCKRMPKKPCIRRQIGLCSAPCVEPEAYAENVRSAARVLDGNTAEIVRDLKDGMATASRDQNFELALKLRDQISALSYLRERQNMERLKRYDEDIINYIIGDKVYLIVFNVHKGTLVNKQDFTFDNTPDFLEEFIVQYYSENPVPKELILPVKVDGPMVEFLSKKRGSMVRINTPKIGEKKKLLDLVLKNVEITFFGDAEKTESLRKALRLADPPNVIECFDISHLSGTAMVGSMVQFRNARPDKSNYRRFRIQAVEGIDDFAAIAEVVRRRYSRLKQENSQMPDLIVIDGGKGQLSSARTELEKLGLDIPMIGIAKREEEIYFPGSRFPLKLDRKDKALQLIQEIRDEAHRFAIKYNRLLRGKAATAN